MEIKQDMKKALQKIVSRSTLKRLPLYLHLLENLHAAGTKYVSCTRIAEEFYFDPTQVRKDLAATGEVGTARIGFNVASLIVRIKEFLGWDKKQDAFLVGVGNLGKAILGYKDFEKYGINIVAAFDANPQVVGSIVFGHKVYSISKLKDVFSKMPVHIGIVTVPADQAQLVVDLMVKSGLKAIWNFAPAPLKIPKDIILENVRLTQSLGVLTNKLKCKVEG